MDQEGIDVAVLFPSRGLFTLAVDGMDPALSAAIGRAYNDWMYDFCQAYPERLYGAGHIAPHDVEAAVAETRRCVEELGFKAIFLRPTMINGRNWQDPYYDPLWAACQRLGIPVGFHEGGRPPYISQVGNQFPTGMLQHVYSHSVGMMLAVGSFCGGGILERFPELRVAFLEGNCSWVPWLLWRLDEHYEWRGYEHPELTMPPGVCFKRQCFASVECDEWPSKYVDAAGYGHTVVFSTDYPHPDSKYPHAVDNFLGMDLPDETKRKYLWDNCARLYGFAPEQEYRRQTYASRGSGPLRRHMAGALRQRKEVHPVTTEKKAELERTTRLRGFRYGLHDFLAALDLHALKAVNDHVEADYVN